MSLVHESITTCLQDVLAAVPALQGIFVTTNDGVEVASVAQPGFDKQILSNIYVFAAERGGKIGRGAVKSMACTYEDVMYIHTSLSPLTLTFVGGTEMESKAVRKVLPSIENLLEPIKSAIAQIEEDDDDDE
jgi:hypothetical protein